jgi:mono/diheme cytochrome c family protein
MWAMLGPAMKTNQLRESRIAHALFFAGRFIAVALGLLAVVGQNAPKTELEAWTAPARAARKQNPIPADATSLAQGKELFAAACLPCHGPMGKGDGPVSGTLERNGVPVRPGDLSNTRLWEQTDGTLFWKISEGRSPMPSFQEGFSEEQRWQIVNFVRTLAPREGDKSQPVKPGGGQ